MFGGAAKDPPGGSFAGFGSIGRGSGAIVVSFMGRVVRRIGWCRDVDTTG